jgi:hypothetical protein
LSRMGASDGVGERPRSAPDEAEGDDRPPAATAMTVPPAAIDASAATSISPDGP